MIRIAVHSTSAVITAQGTLTVGLRGAKVRFSFLESWTGLTKTAVFRQGEKTVTVANIGPEVTIPWEVLTVPGVPVQIGVYGVNSTGNIAIPTVWAVTRPVQPGADPEGDPSTEPTPGLWEQIQWKMGSLEQLETSNRSSLVAAINEANREVYVVTVTENADGSYQADRSPNMIQAALDREKPVACHWYEKNVMAYLTGFQTGGPYTFSSVYDQVEYQIVIRDSGVSCKKTELAKKTDLPITAKVTVTEDGDGKYTADLYYDDILKKHNQGYTVYCQWGHRVLSLASISSYAATFAWLNTASDNVFYTVFITDKTVKVTARTLDQEAVLYTYQTLSDTQKYLARQNIGACDEAFVRNAIADADIPKKVSQLENDIGYLTEVPGTFLVTVTKDGDGTYTADRTYMDLLMAQMAGDTLLCFYSNESVYLPLTQDGPFTFSAIVNSYLYQIDIYLTGGDHPVGPRFSKTELTSASAVLYTPQALTDEQKAQVKQNIGACDEAFVRNAIAEYDAEAMALLGEDGENE